MQSQVTYRDLFVDAKVESSSSGSKLGAKARYAAGTVNAAAKFAVGMTCAYSTIGVGHLAGYVQGFWRGLTGKQTRGG